MDDNRDHHDLRAADGTDQDAAKQPAHHKKTSSRRVRQILFAPLILIASLLMWIEEHLWEWLKQLTALIGRIKLIHWLETGIQRLPPYATIVVFLLPSTLLIPFKFMAVYWFVNGYWLAGTMTLIAAKIFATAVVARMYVVCKPKLMEIWWFKWVHDFLIDIRNRLYSAVAALPFYQLVRAQLAVLKEYARRWMKRIRLRVRTGWRSIYCWLTGQ